MTNVYIHGALGREFGRKFRFSLNRAKDVFFALDANKPGFWQRVLSLGKTGAHYQIVVDGQNISSPLDIQVKKNPQNIHIMPAICGSAGVVAAVGLIVAVVGYAGTFGAVVSGILIAVGTAALSYGISNLLQKDQKTDVGSASATANALNKSFLFTNGENVAEQGNPVAIGFGRLRIGSAVIQSTIKSYPARYDENSSLPIFSEFTELATKRGLSKMAILTSEQPIQTNL